jgi:Uma2 family endonuclease
MLSHPFGVKTIPLRDFAVPKVRLEDVPESDRQYEIVDGEKLWLPLRSIYACEMAHILCEDLSAYLAGRGVGRAYMHMPYQLPLTFPTVRKPMVSYLSFERFPRNHPIANGAEGLPAVPELVTEILGPEDYAETTLQKVEEYFDAGVRHVWIGYPIRKVMHAFDSFTSVRVLRPGDSLAAEETLPGFRVELSRLFSNPPRSNRNPV